MSSPRSLPIVYSCSGCSSVAQLANDIAIKLDRDGHAKMSCIAGVGGGVTPLVKEAKQAKQIVVLDGCPLNCCRHCLAKENISPALSINLNHFGVRKKQGEDYDPADFLRVYEEVLLKIKLNFNQEE